MKAIGWILLIVGGACFGSGVFLMISMILAGPSPQFLVNLAAGLWAVPLCLLPGGILLGLGALVRSKAPTVPRSKTPVPAPDATATPIPPWEKR